MSVYQHIHVEGISEKDFWERLGKVATKSTDPKHPDVWEIVQADWRFKFYANYADGCGRLMSFNYDTIPNLVVMALADRPDCFASLAWSSENIRLGKGKPATWRRKASSGLKHIYAERIKS